MEWCTWVNVTFNNLVIHLTIVIPWCRWVNVTFNNLVIPWNGVDGLTSHLTI